MCWFHDWEIIESINSMVFEDWGKIGRELRCFYRNRNKKYYKKVCLKCGKIVDEITLEKDKYEKIYKEKITRRQLAKELSEKQSKNNKPLRIINI